LTALVRVKMECIGRALTSAPSGRKIRFGYIDKYGFNFLGHAVISRDIKWKTPAFFHSKIYDIEENFK